MLFSLRLFLFGLALSWATLVPLHPSPARACSPGYVLSVPPGQGSTAAAAAAVQTPILELLGFDRSSNNVGTSCADTSRVSFRVLNPQEGAVYRMESGTEGGGWSTPQFIRLPLDGILSSVRRENLTRACQPWTAALRLTPLDANAIPIDDKVAEITVTDTPPAEGCCTPANLATGCRDPRTGEVMSVTNAAALPADGGGSSCALANAPRSGRASYALWCTFLALILVRRRRREGRQDSTRAGRWKA